ncbi:hypothetical protein GCM10027425_05480 [Alteromonas gracilis]
MLDSFLGLLDRASWVLTTLIVGGLAAMAWRYDDPLRWSATLLAVALVIGTIVSLTPRRPSIEGLQNVAFDVALATVVLRLLGDRTWGLVLGILVGIAAVSMLVRYVGDVRSLRRERTLQPTP